MSRIDAELARIGNYAGDMERELRDATEVTKTVLAAGLLYTEREGPLFLCPGCAQQSFHPPGEGYPHNAGDTVCSVLVLEQWRQKALAVLTKGPYEDDAPRDF